MNYFKKFLLFAVIMLVAMPAYAVNSPKTVIAQIKDSQGNFPAANNLTVQVTDANAQTATLTTAATDGILSYNATNGGLTINMGNFTTQWAATNTLTIKAWIGTAGQAGYEVAQNSTTLDSTSLQAFTTDTNLSLALAGPLMTVAAASNNQSAAVGAVVTNAPSVTLSTGGTADVGVSVTFTAATGATFATSGTNTETVVTDASGVATTSALTLSTTAGAQNVTAAATGYTTQTINLTATPGTATAANSTITAGGATTITADSTAVFIVTFKDQYGNATSALGGAALAASGNALGGATWAVVDGGAGTATATYTPSTAGSETALAVTLGGTQIGANQTVTVNPGTAAAATSTIVAAGSTNITADQTATFTITFKDAKGNATTTVGTLAASGKALTGATWAVVDNGTGTATATYTPSAAGTDSALKVTLGGTQIGTNQSVTVTPGAAVAGSSVATWSAASTTADNTSTLTIQLVDAKGNNLTAGGATVAVTGNALTGSALSAVTDNTNGTYSVTYTPSATGTENLSMTVNTAAGSTIPTLTVTPGVAVATNTQPVGTPPSTTDADTSVTVSLQLYDQFGNKLTKGGDTVTAAAATLTGASFSTPKDNGDGTYSVTYTPHATGTETFTATVNGTTLPGSTFTVTPGASVAANAAATWAASTITADGTGTLTIQLKDQFSNLLTAGGATVAVSGNALTGSALSATTTDNGNGTYSVTYTPSAAGTENLSFTVGGTAGSTVPALTVTNGAADHIITTLSPATIGSNGSSTTTATATIYDAKGNVVTTGASATATVTFSAATGSALVNLGTGTATASAGVASLVITSVNSATGGSATIDATITGLATPASNTTAALTLSPFSLDKTAINLVAGDSYTFTLTGCTAASNWTQTPGATPTSGTLGTQSTPTGGACTRTYTAGTAAGTETLTVTDSVGGNTVTSSATITVKTAVAATPAATGVATSGATNTTQITASGGDQTYTYVSSDPTVLTVSNAGLVTGVKAGTATVTVTDGTTYNGTKTANSATTATITVAAPIAVTSGTTVYLDTANNKTSTITLTGGTAGNTFTSGNTAVATVDANGVITAVAAGTTTIAINEATYNTSAATVTVTVQKPLAINDSAGTALTTAQTVLPTGSLTVAPAGGSGTYTASITDPASATTPLTADAKGNFTFTPPTTGAFAGSYTLTLTDSTSSLTTTLSINVPMKVTVSAPGILESDTTQTVTVTGAAAGDSISFAMLDSTGAADTSGATATVTATATAAANAATGNPAVATITPANVSSIATFKVQATNTVQTALAAVNSPAMAIIPENLVTLTVTDSATGAAITGATVKLRMPAPIIAAGNVTTTTDAQGQVTPTLPVGKDVFDVTMANYNPGVITLAQGTVTGSVSLTPFSAPVAYTGNITGTGTVDFTVNAPTVVAVDANGNTVTAETVSVGSATAATFTLTVDSNTFTPVKFVASAAGAFSDDQDAASGVTSGLAFTLDPIPATVSTTDIDSAAPTGAEFTAGTITAPLVGSTTLPATVTLIQVATKPTGTATATGAGTATVSGNEPVIQLMTGAGGATDVVTAPVSYKPLLDPTTGAERRDSGGTQPSIIGASTPDTFALSKLTTTSSVGVQIPTDAFKTGAAVKKVFTTVSGATTTSTHASLTGGDVVEVDVVAIDNTGAVLSTGSGNAILNKVLVQVPISLDAVVAAGYTAATANAAFASGALVIYTAPSIQDFEAGNVTAVTGTVTYNPVTGMASFYTNHFSAFGAGAGSSVVNTNTSGIFGGCTLSSVPGKVDPMFPLLVLAAVFVLWRRRRQEA